jgi:hypothetical protein
VIDVKRLGTADWPWCPCCAAHKSTTDCACTTLDRQDFAVARDFLNDSARASARDERFGLVALMRRVRAEEREACAKVAEGYKYTDPFGDDTRDATDVAHDIATDIRARGGS